MISSRFACYFIFSISCYLKWAKRCCCSLATIECWTKRCLLFVWLYDIIVNHFHHLHRLFPCIISIHLSSKVQINMTSMLAKCWIFYGDKSLPSYNFYIVCQKIWRYLYHLLACVHWKFMNFPIPLWICTEFFTKRHATLYFPFMPDIKEA